MVAKVLQNLIDFLSFYHKKQDAESMFNLFSLIKDYLVDQKDGIQQPRNENTLNYLIHILSEHFELFDTLRFLAHLCSNLYYSCIHHFYILEILLITHID